MLELVRAFWCLVNLRILLLIFFACFISLLTELFEACSVSPSDFIAVHVVDAALLAHEEHALLAFDLDEPHHFSIKHVNALSIFFIVFVGSLLLVQSWILRTFVHGLLSISKLLLIGAIVKLVVLRFNNALVLNMNLFVLNGWLLLECWHGLHPLALRDKVRIGNGTVSTSERW